MIKKIGFMQGRLSPIIDGKIQAFPWDHWRNEIALGNELGINIMEWTIDQNRLYENPIMTEEGQDEIKSLCKKYNFLIPSLTGDCFMQAPFWKTSDSRYSEKLKNDFKAIVNSCNKTNIKLLVVPLVDEGSLTNIHEENALIDFLIDQQLYFKRSGVRIAFESDYSPLELYNFISKLDYDIFGINYDIGNSASLGFNPLEEFKYIGERIKNVHVKDRPLGGSTVPLGEGDADFKNVFNLLKSYNYKENYILQTARSIDERHDEVLINYKKYVEGYI